MPLTAPQGKPQPHPFSAEILRMVKAYDASRPRSMQTFLGPSEIGAPCDRQLAMKLAGVPEINQVADPWFPIVGSAVHEWLARMVEWYNDTYLNRATNPRFLAEQRVQVDGHGGYNTSGSTDLYDLDRQRVVDWKIVGATTMRKIDPAAPRSVGPQYYIQGQTYGAGWVQAGYPVKTILIAFLPRSNYLNKMKLVEFPFDPTVAPKAQARVAAIDQLRHHIPPHEFPVGGCTIWCPFYRPSVPIGPTSCPGHGEIGD